MWIYDWGDVLSWTDVEESYVDLAELRDNPDDYLIFSVKQPMRCKRCDKPLTIRKKKRFISFLCGCGCRLFYPADKNGVLQTTYVDAKAYYEKMIRNGKGK